MKSRREQLLNDDIWPEVAYVNAYAVFMGYLSMATKGLGFLILTWTTVVLLGGFVSNVNKKDFWCLTFITLVQTAGIFDVSTNEKLVYMKKAARGLVAGVTSGVGYPAIACYWFALFFAMIQVVIFAALLCPLAIIYMFGIVISGGISLWRLIEHDWGGSSGEVPSNLPPAMTTLYVLAVLQSFIFCYRFVLRCMQKRMAKRIATKCDASGVELYYNYLRETRRGCEKDPSFAKERNHITYAIEKIGSNSPVDCVSGIKMLYTTICTVETQLKVTRCRMVRHRLLDIATSQRMLMKHLVVSASSSRHILQKLLETLDSRGLHDTETRHQAAKIVECLALDINLELFPWGIEHISSLIGTFEEYSIAEPYHRDSLYDEHEQHWKLHVSHELPLLFSTAPQEYKKLLLRGMCILRKLGANRNNCRVIIDTPDLVSKIMAPITSDLLHSTKDDHGAWSDVVKGSMEVMIQLNDAPGEIGVNLRCEISNCKEAISTLWMIIRCDKCNESIQKRAIQLLTQLHIGSTTESNNSTDNFLQKIESNESNSVDCVAVKKGKSIGSSSREKFVSMLVDIFMSNNKYSNSTRGYTGVALSEICFHGGISDATIVMQTRDDVVDSLTNVLVHDKNQICRQSAADILEHLCTHYTKDDESLDKLKIAMSNVMPEVIGEIFTYVEKEVAHGDEMKRQRDFSSVSFYWDLYNYKDNTFFGKLKKAVLKILEKKRCKSCKGKKANEEEGRLIKPEADIENQLVNRHGKGSTFSSSCRQRNGKKVPMVVVRPVMSVTLLSSLLCLSGTFYDRSIGELGPDLAPKVHASSFLGKLREFVVQSFAHLTFENLSLYKAIATIVISITKHGGGQFIKRGDLEGMMQVLSNAAEMMLDLDHSMVFRSTNNSKILSSKLHRCTLASLVNDLHIMVMTQMDSVNITKESTNIGPEGMMFEDAKASLSCRQPKETMGVTQMDSADIRKESVHIGLDAIILERIQNSVRCTQTKELHTGKAMPRHNKPKKADTEVTPQDYICTPDDVSVIKYIKSKPKKCKLVEIDDSFLTKADLECLINDDVFLDGNVINAYIYCISAQDYLQERAGGKVHLDSTYMSALLKRDGDTKIDLADHNNIVKQVDNYLKHDMLFLPINNPNSHWYLSVVNAKKREIQVLDSRGRTDRTELNTTLKGLKKHLDIASKRKGFNRGVKWQDLDVTTWQVVEEFQEDMQSDGSSCGLFMLNYMEYWTGEMMSDSVTQEDMRQFRRKLLVLLFDSELNKIKKKSNI